VRVQSRYAGYVGDFAKLGLLRHVAVPMTTCAGSALSIAVNWRGHPAHNANLTTSPANVMNAADGRSTAGACGLLRC
jgi:hypothetical protein